MALTEYKTFNAVTVGATELSIVSGTTTLATDTTAGVFQLFVDPFNMALGDSYIFRVYEKVLSTGTKRQLFSMTLTDGQVEALVTPALHLRNGWDMTIQKLAGTDRAFTASIRQAA
jgi:hypothetical protein